MCVSCNNQTVPQPTSTFYCSIEKFKDKARLTDSVSSALNLVIKNTPPIEMFLTIGVQFIKLQKIYKCSYPPILLDIELCPHVLGSFPEQMYLLPYNGLCQDLRKVDIRYPMY